jgi:histone H3/H4
MDCMGLTPHQEAVMAEIIVVASKVKSYVKEKAGMNTSATFLEVLSDQCKKLCDDAIAAAQKDGRKTVKDRDLQASGNGFSGDF